MQKNFVILWVYSATPFNGLIQTSGAGYFLPRKHISLELPQCFFVAVEFPLSSTALLLYCH